MAMPRSMQRPPKIESTVYKAEADTNIYRVALSCLKDAAEMATGDPEECEKC